MLYLWLCCRWKFATFGSGAQGEICWTSFSASPDARAEGAPVTTEAAHLCSSTSLKKLRPYLLILWCCRMYKSLSQCWAGGAASGVRHLPGNWCQPESYWTLWTRVVMLWPGWPVPQLSCPLLPCLLLLLRDSKNPLLYSHMKMLYLTKCSQIPMTELCTLYISLKNGWICAGCFYPELSPAC